MTLDSLQLLKKVYATENVVKIDDIQSLWSGYGMIRRFRVEGEGDKHQVVVKHVSFSEKTDSHPRGWNTKNSHLRKVRSYQVENNFYEHYSKLCSAICRIPMFIYCESTTDGSCLILEDLNPAGFDERKSVGTIDEVKDCLRWLAHFHTVFLGVEPAQLWQQGSYWHLDTRPDEFYEMQDVGLKKYAREIDSELKHATYKTIIHGDAKLANFCFSSAKEKVAAVDFQYVGGGVGVTDVAYFLGSCLTSDELEKHEVDLLKYYFDELTTSVEKEFSNIDANALEAEWRRLYNWAIADFNRFLNGWAPDHAKINPYNLTRTNKVLDELEKRYG